MNTPLKQQFASKANPELAGDAAKAAGQDLLKSLSPDVAAAFAAMEVPEGSPMAPSPAQVDSAEWWLLIVPVDGSLPELKPMDTLRELLQALWLLEGKDVFAHAFYGCHLDFTTRSFNNGKTPFRLLYAPNGLAIPIRDPNMSGTYWPDLSAQFDIEEMGYMGPTELREQWMDDVAEASKVSDPDDDDDDEDYDDDDD